MKKLALMAFLAAAPAEADVIFFTEASGEPGIRVSAQLAVTNEAFAGGLDLDRKYDSRQPAALQEVGNLDGLRSLTFTLTQNDQAPFRSYTLDDFFVPSPSMFIPFLNSIRISSAPAGLPNLEVRLLNNEDLFSFSFGATWSSGLFATDAPSPCFLQPSTTCRFTGASPLVVSVPEPAPLAIFGAALLGVALVSQWRLRFGLEPAAEA